MDLPPASYELQVLQQLRFLILGQVVLGECGHPAMVIVIGTPGRRYEIAGPVHQVLEADGIGLGERVEDVG